MADNIFPSAAEIDNNFFGGSNTVPSDKINNQKTEENTQEKNQNSDNKQNEPNKQNNIDKESNKAEKNNKEESQNSNNQTNTQIDNKNNFKENSIKALKELGFNTKDNKIFIRKIKNFDVKIEIS